MKKSKKKNKLNNYKSTFILLGSIIIGGIVGLIWKDKASILSPFGDLFLNMLLIVVVPLIFLTITSSIYKMREPKRIGKILITTFIVFLITSIVAVLIGVASTYTFKLVDTKDGKKIKESLVIDDKAPEKEELDILNRTVQAVSVNDFAKLLSRDNMIALIVVSMLVGIAMSMSKEKAEPLYNLINSSTDVLMNFIKLIMYYAPIGLGCYFAAMVGTFGGAIAVGYFKTFIIYLLTCIFFYFIIYSLFAYISAGKLGIRRFWTNILPSTLTALATCSSAASMPVNIECTKKIGISDDIAETTVSLGTSFHKDGSVIGSVFKIMFLVYLFNDITDITIIKIMGIALIATLLVTAVPIGGGTISEMLIITMLGYPIAALPILTIIATIIDSPATILNVVGDSASAMLTNRIVDGKKWLK
ncbi:MAG: dicarboxylate/amino acid:cation symporter [Bacilli bacterium]|nr:dicarboxylate/amino acid:cation symporter [Bacilli bacterium]